MAPPVIASKLFVPALKHGVIHRPRLAALMRRGAETRLTLVSAPAGFGKTTLLAEWLNGTAGEDRRVAWLSLDSADRDPAVFWISVVTALQAAVTGLDPALLVQLASPPPATERVLTTVLNEVAATPNDVWLVLDDYHLADGREVGKELAFLLENLPPQVHVAISTRADPEIPLSHWRVRGELVEIRAADLHFTSEESAEYFKGVSGVNLSLEQATALSQ